MFAILFQKKFVVLDNQSGGTDRIHTLLNMLQIKQRFMRDLTHIGVLGDLLETPIPYELVMERLDYCRKDSLAFLANIKK